MARSLVAPLVLALLLAPLLSGCLSDGDEASPAAQGVTRTAAEAGASTGPAPSAPKESFVVTPEGEAQVVAYPIPIRTNAAKAPLALDLSGSFAPADCRPLRFGPLEEVLAPASVPSRETDLAEHIAVGDVFAYEIELTYTNSHENWGEIHAAYGLGSTVRVHGESTRELTDVSINWSGQGFRASDEDMAWLEVACWYGQMTQPIPYALKVALTFADAAVPAEAPVLVPVPEGATRLFVRGVAIDPDAGVSSHFRLFGPDDALVCECALGSATEVATIPVTPGDHVLLVDHTANGFVSVASDAPALEDARALDSEWVETPVLAADGGPVDATVEVDLPTVPLLMHGYVLQKEPAGAGKKTALTVTNGRGEALAIAWGGHLAWRDPIGGQAWLGFWPADWDYRVDHHAFAPGGHAAHVQAEQLRGEIFLLTRHYVR